jgi:hypothetical protein
VHNSEETGIVSHLEIQTYSNQEDAEYTNEFSIKRHETVLAKITFL